MKNQKTRSSSSSYEIDHSPRVSMSQKELDRLLELQREYVIAEINAASCQTRHDLLSADEAEEAFQDEYERMTGSE